MIPIATARVPEGTRAEEPMLIDMNVAFGSDNSEYVYDVDVVVQSFKVLLSVPRRTRWWRPEYGVARLYSLLFEPFDQVTADAIANAIQIVGDSALNGNARMTVREIKVMPASDSTYYCEAKLRILGFGDSTITFGLKKIN